MGSGLTIRGCTPDIRSEKVPRGVRVCYLLEEKPEIDICGFCISRILPSGKSPCERTALKWLEKLRPAQHLVCGLEPLALLHTSTSIQSTAIARLGWGTRLRQSPRRFAREA